VRAWLVHVGRARAYRRERRSRRGKEPHFQISVPVDPGRASDDMRLLRSLPYLMDLETTHRSRVGVFQFVRRERADNSFLIGSDQVRECTGFKMKHDNLLRLVDEVRAVVRHRFWNQAAAFLGIRLVWVIGGDFRIVGTCDQDKKRPFASKTLTPVGLAPNCSSLLPSAPARKRRERCACE
jgi:hypothetical protein